MKTSTSKIITAVVSLLIAGVFVILLIHSGKAQNPVSPPLSPVAENTTISHITKLASSPASVVPAASVAPFVIRDTDTDSPGTNIVTRIVTITAAVGGAPSVARQWKVDHGRGFVPLSGATNETFRIGNAQVADSGFYALFATNAAGQLHTTPVQLVVTEGED